MRPLVRPLLAAVLAIIALAAPASAAGRHNDRRSHAPVRLINLPGGGTLIHVRADERGRTVVLSPEIIAAAAIRDVDADGDLDILASSGRGLILWRNLGAGRYVLAAAPSTRSVHRRAAPGVASFRQLGQASRIGEQRQQLAASGSSLTTRVVPAAPATPASAAVPCSAASRTHAGRAPPLLA